jgi:hypothetical protein
LLLYLISQEGIPLHVEPGNIFKREAGTKMEEEVLKERTAVQIDNEGNITIILPV